MLPDAEIVKLANRERLVLMSRVWTAIQDDATAQQHAAGEREGRSVEQDDVHGVGGEVACHGADNAEANGLQVCARRHMDGDIDVAPWCQPASDRAAEEIRELDGFRTRADGVAKAGETLLQVGGQREVQRHDVSITAAFRVLPDIVAKLGEGPSALEEWLP